MRFLSTIDRVVARWERGAAVALLTVTVVIVVLQVFFRYVLTRSLGWSDLEKKKRRDHTTGLPRLPTMLGTTISPPCSGSNPAIS